VISEAKKIPLTGRLLLIGGEDNDDLGLPDSDVIRFTAKAPNLFGFFEKFDETIRKIAAKNMKAYREGKPENAIHNVVIDGWSELVYAYLWAYREANEDKLIKDKWAPYREWQRDFIAIMQILNPKAIGANVFGTARVGEFKKGIKSKGAKEVTGDDPEYMSDFRYHPAMEGWAKYNLGHYFQNIVYFDSEPRTKVKNGAKFLVNAHKAHWLPTGDYMVKNTAEHKWLAKEHPPILEDEFFGKASEYLFGDSGLWIPRRFLFYGAPGGGKTAGAVSSWWDFIKEEPIVGLVPEHGWQS